MVWCVANAGRWVWVGIISSAGGCGVVWGVAKAGRWLWCGCG